MLPYIQTWFIQGLLHPFQTPSHLILMISLGFLVGQNTPIKKLLLLIVMSTILGLLLNQIVKMPLGGDIELILLSMALINGLLVVIRFKYLNRLLLGLLVGFSGLLLGYDSSPIMVPGLGINSIYNWIFAAGLSIIIGATMLSALAKFLRPSWDGIILRVIGSWIATSALFTLTLSLAKF